MSNSYSFLVDLCSSGFCKRFKISDGTLWEVQEYWSFIDNTNADLVDNLAHIIIVRQRNHLERTYSKKMTAYPLEQTNYTTIEKEMNDPTSYWFSVTFREYDECFRPGGKGSFRKILCKLDFASNSATTSETYLISSEELRARSQSFKKRYNYSSLQNISSSDIKNITLKTMVDFLLDAMLLGTAEEKLEATEYIVKNYAEVRRTESWRAFSVNYPELKDEILDKIIDNLSNQNERASWVLQTGISKWHEAE